MRQILIFGFAVLGAFNASAQVAVPGSTSPDKSAALYYRHLPSTTNEYEVYFRDPQSLSLLSKNLVPDAPTDLRTGAGEDDFESKMLFDMIGGHYEAMRNHVLWDSGFSYDVVWSHDSQWVCVEGGAHKFWRTMIYHSVNDHFQRVLLSDLQLGTYFEAHKTNLHVQDRSVAATIHKISPHDEQRCLWLKDGTLALNAYAYLLRNSDYEKLETYDFFFVVDAHANPATITGFCR